MAVHDLNLWLAAGCLTLLVAVVGVRLSARIGLPGMLLYLGLGLVIGEAGLGFEFSNVELTRDLGLVALAVILAEGGLTTRWSLISRHWDSRSCLPRSELRCQWRLLRGSPPPARLRSAYVADSRRSGLIDGRCCGLLGVACDTTAEVDRGPLEAESGFNDAPTVILVTLLASESWDSTGVLGSVGLVGYELIVGAARGLCSVGLVRASCRESPCPLLVCTRSRPSRLRCCRTPLPDWSTPVASWPRT